MASWCLKISDAQPPAPGIYRALSKVGGTQTVRTHEMQATRTRAGGPCFFIYTGARAINHQYPHVTVMLDSPLYQRAGLLFFRSGSFHVSLANDHKLFYSVANGRFEVEHGQGGMLSLDEMKAMGSTVCAILRTDITQGISPQVLAQGRGNLAPEDSYGQPPWEREARERQALENDQARLRGIVQGRNEAWARQFEWPDGM